MSVTINERAIQELLFSRTGPVGRDIAARGARVLSAAKSLGASRVKVRTGQYVASFRMGDLPNGNGPAVVIENLAPHGIFIELGTRPHIIRAKNARSLYSKATGQFFGPVVHHPGTVARNVLRDSLDAAR